MFTISSPVGSLSPVSFPCPVACAGPGDSPSVWVLPTAPRRVSSPFLRSLDFLEAGIGSEACPGSASLFWGGLRCCGVFPSGVLLFGGVRLIAPDFWMCSFTRAVRCRQPGLSLLPHLSAGTALLWAWAPGDTVSRAGRTMLHLVPLLATCPFTSLTGEEAELLRQCATRLLGHKAESQ